MLRPSSGSPGPARANTQGFYLCRMPEHDAAIQPKIQHRAHRKSRTKTPISHPVRFQNKTLKEETKTSASSNPSLGNTWCCSVYNCSHVWLCNYCEISSVWRLQLSVRDSKCGQWGSLDDGWWSKTLLELTCMWADAETMCCYPLLLIINVHFGSYLYVAFFIYLFIYLLATSSLRKNCIFMSFYCWSNAGYICWLGMKPWLTEKGKQISYQKSRFLFFQTFRHLKWVFELIMNFSLSEHMKKMPEWTSGHKGWWTRGATALSKNTQYVNCCLLKSRIQKIFTLRSFLWLVFWFESFDLLHAQWNVKKWWRLKMFFFFFFFFFFGETVQDPTSP